MKKDWRPAIVVAAILFAFWLFGQIASLGSHDQPGTTVAQATPSADPTDSPDPSVADSE